MLESNSRTAVNFEPNQMEASSKKHYLHAAVNNLTKLDR